MNGLFKSVHALMVGAVVGVVFSTTVFASNARLDSEALFEQYASEVVRTMQEGFRQQIQLYQQYSNAKADSDGQLSWLSQTQFSADIVEDAEVYESQSDNFHELALDFIRQSSDQDLVRVLRRADALPAALFLSRFTVEMTFDPTDEFTDKNELSRLKLLISSDRSLQDLILNLWLDDRSIVKLIFEQPGHDDLVTQIDKLWGLAESLALGSILSYSAVTLLPEDRLLAFLDRVTSNDNIHQLPDHIRDLIEDGVFFAFVDVPSDWLAEQVEQGRMIWLNTLIQKNPDNAFALQDDYIEQLTVSQQLSFIQNQPKAEHLVQLRRIWQQATNELNCFDCDSDEPAVDHWDLAFALIAMPGQEPVDMLLELLDLQHIMGEKQDIETIVNMMLHSSHPAMMRAGLQLAEDIERFPLLHLPMYKLSELHTADAETLLAIVTTRVDQFKAASEAQREALSTSFLACDLSAQMLYAQVHGVPTEWSTWLESHGSLAQTQDWCAQSFAAVIASSKDAAALDLVMDTYLRDNAPVSAWSRLVSALRWMLDAEPDHLTERLVDTAIWDELSQSDRDWLLGIQTPADAAISCEGAVLPED